MSNLPEACPAINQPPFTNTGIDYFGPLTVKQGRRTRSTDGTSKRYGAISTCLSTRAVHIELVGNLSTDNFILALYRFISRRGYPMNIFSDNGTNFTGVQRELTKSLTSLDQDRIEAELTPHEINWNFSLPVSPWMNGAMETIVKITKKHLNTITRNHLFNKETLHTYLTEIESIINGRPLTPLSDDINHFKALMPNHFLTGTANPNLLICPVQKPGGIVNKRKWKAVQVALKSFWQRRIRKYLPITTTRKKWNIPIRNFVVEDLVLIADKNIPRSNWLLPRITEIHQSKDNVIKVVKLKTKFGTYTRPAANLCLLEESLAKKRILNLTID